MPGFGSYGPGEISRANGLTDQRLSWEYDKGGVKIKEVDVGQPCGDCDKCTGYSPHIWRKTCQTCKCVREAHEVISEHGARSRLGFTTSHDGLEPRSLGYTWVPVGLSTRQIEQFYSQLTSTDIPRLGSEGETLRNQRLVKQLPRQDLALAACKYIEAEHEASYQDFIQARNEIALDVGIARTAPHGGTCAGCSKGLLGATCVSASRLGAASLWHPGCFRCHECHDLLVDLAYCVHDGDIYCERHYAEQMKPRCSACDEVSSNSCYVCMMEVRRVR